MNAAAFLHAYDTVQRLADDVAEITRMVDEAQGALHRDVYENAEFHAQRASLALRDAYARSREVRQHIAALVEE